MMMQPQELLLYCRPGFEADLAAEVSEKAAYIGTPGYPIAARDSGFVRYVVTSDEPANALHRDMPLQALVFARQTLVALEPLVGMSRENRVSPILQQVVDAGWSFEEIRHEMPDTNDGKALSGLGKAVGRPLESALKKRGALRRKAGGRALHVFWTDGDEVQLGMSFPGNRSEYANGIRHLRSPSRAPSRSTLKLEEAWHEFVPRDQWERRIATGMQAADLGAAPGGWTFQLVEKGMFVFAIDNGPMNKDLMATGQVEHLKEDGFTWEPPLRLDWLVCDIVDKPIRVTEMVERWLKKRWCNEAVFNLKLPMKQRWKEVSRCLDYLAASLERSNVGAEIRCRHLYHDREEVTVHVRITH
ncbi:MULTISPECIES: 23S rRNA (cytidine(2498)-2'-O)-methyltransferase RlmM [Cobetia]|uniref:23S rRNA (cytidine(2498)-2'-O)-methyltransferase RlmM n=1 Tax=Cobetia TaxID=204286 RepID=UPI001581FBAE|nr:MULTISPECIES: 23S rRNA (cytidine(2498)-2'-O)-methyltransferase RlmM [Cobetia]MDI4660227.1 23S rRNA (cytidine(2498)-2'-O)-methyltransferase RlmM [Cobetia sp. BMC6]MDL2192883.1 23S rRNA (cytidine(2498)-2'-O)-methyltransferase RlmM [Cobetia sp. LC6]NUJ57722.1 23S rRNA (cytidine(2498)-2'-O)-methyltransferase RlmM [Cobetia marina]